MAFSPDGLTLASESDFLLESLDSDAIRLWNTEAGLQETTLENPVFRALSLVFSPDRRTLASGGRDGTILLWDIAKTPTPRQIAEYSVGSTVLEVKIEIF